MSTPNFETIEFDDYEEEINDKKPDDFMSIFMDFFSTLNYKLLMFIFIIFIFITSDIFVEKILGKIDGTVNHREPTSKGAFMQGLFMVFFYMIFDLVIKLGFV